MPPPSHHGNDPVRSSLRDPSLTQDRDETNTVNPRANALEIDSTISATNQRLISAVAQASNAENSRQAVLENSSTAAQLPTGSSRALGAPSPNIASDNSGRALSRNLARLQTEIRSGEEMLGESPIVPESSISSHSETGIPLAEQPEHLPNDPSQIFTRKIPRPPLSTPKIVHNVNTLVSLCERKVKTPRSSPFVHETNLEAAEKNSSLIASFDFDLQRLIDAFPESTISPGSEFRPVQDIQQVLGSHPFWPKIWDILTNGASYTFKTLPPDCDRLKENEAIFEYGNHASARKKPEALHKVMAKDSKFGYAFPVTFDCAKQIKNGRAGPLGVAQHAGIDEKGEIILKDRLAHDQTFSFGHAPSLNKLVDESVLIDLVYGWCIDRVIHQIVAIRQLHPNEKIFICKFDWGAAYRRINGDGTLTANSITSDADGRFANLLLRLSFGGKPHPAIFSTISEAACDLCNDIVEIAEWNPEICKSPLQSMMGPTNRLPAEIPFAKSREMAVDVLARPEGFHDVYLDDMIQIFIDRPEIVSRTSSIVPLALHLLVRPNNDDEPIARNEILAADKMQAEGCPSEEMRVLGWLLDTRRMLIKLPSDKFLNWSKAVDKMLEAKTCTFNEIDSLLGKLTHATKGIPLARYFTKRMRQYVTALTRKYQAKYGKHRSPADEHQPEITGARRGQNRPKPWFRYKVPEAIRPDLRLWTHLLRKAHDGVSFNLLTCRRPSHVFLADSCPFGMGGFSVTTGKAWHCPLDPNIYAQAATAADMKDDEIFGEPDNNLSNNLFEFICQVVTVWIACIDGSIGDEDCILCLSDSSSATAWLHRSSFGIQKTNHQRVSEKLTLLALDNNFTLHPEHIPGKANVVTDALSRTFDCSDESLTKKLISLYPSQVPANFNIYPLPTEIKSWLCSVAPLQHASSSDALNPPTRTWTEPGDAGCSTSNSSESKTTPFWTASRPFGTDHRSSAPSCSDSVTALSAEGVENNLRAGTVEKAVGHLASKFRHFDRPSPCHVQGSNRHHPLVESLKRAWHHLDPEEKRQKAVTPRHLRHMLIELTKCNPDGSNPRDLTSFKACNAELACAAYFNACRSCEYSTVKQRGKTKLLTIGNVIFKRNDELRSEIDPTHPQFEAQAVFVCITFVAQKNGEKFQTRTQSRTNDGLLCPVRLWGRIVRRILFFRPDAPAETPVNCWFDPTVLAAGKTPSPRYIRAEDTIKILRETCVSGGGFARFGYRPLDIGTHSLRSGAAMALFLAKTSVLKIMILGRWSSAAFLRYIRPQVMEWTAGMSTAMLRNPDFRHVDHTSNREITQGDVDALQTNLEAAIESPEEITFNGSVEFATFTSQLNLEF